MATISVDKRTEVSLSKFLFHTLVLPHTTKGGGQNLRFGHSRTVLGVTRFAGVAGVSEAPFWSRPLGRLCLTHDSNSALERSRARKTSSVRTRGAPVALLSQIAGKGVQGKTQRRLLAFALVRLYASVFALLCARSRVKGKDCAKPAQEPYTLVRTSSIARVPETSLLLAPPRRT